MKKVSFVFVVLSVFASYASAQESKEKILQEVISHSDIQFASVVKEIPEANLTIANPAPENQEEILRKVWLYDITEHCTVGYDVVTSYPKIYTMFDSAENHRIIKVYSFKNPNGGYRRIEVYVTGGDWMQYPLVYVITNAGNDKNTVHAYFVDELSTPDHEEGAVAPVVSPSDPKKLVEFIGGNFLESDGSVRSAFRKVATLPLTE